MDVLDSGPARLKEGHDWGRPPPPRRKLQSHRIKKGIENDFPERSFLHTDLY
jgi:hypothetical protein